MKHLLIIASIAIFSIIACTGKTNKNASEKESYTDYELNEIWKTDTVFKTPESVLYDEAREVLYVSNVNGDPSAKDGNGFISRMSPMGVVTDLMWVTGLNAPKGMGVFGNLLYVSDVSDLVVIDIDQAKIINRIPVPDAVFLNDISIDASGKVYISDSRTGKIHTYNDGTLSEWITGLNSPNGLYAEGSRILLATSAFNSINPETGAVTMLTDSIGHGDGIEFTGIEGYYLVSDWTGEIFLVYPDYSKKSLLQTRDQNKNTADIGFNKREKILLVPTFFDNRVVAYEFLPKLD
ncbi:MAG: hypothetical protein H6538_07470 [Bacteroidales bacterium]|nr:hypothetical protein [Bacteroidales bacterium]